MAAIRELWSRLEAWTAEHAPAMAADLAAPATDEEIAELEAKIGRSLPEDLKDSLRIHNGETDGWPCKIFADRGAFLSTQRIAGEWEMRQQIVTQLDEDDSDPDELIREGIISVEGPVQPVMYDPAWLPIMECNGDVFWALDFAPKDGGTAGQVIEVDWEGCSWIVVAASFHELLETYVDELEAGAFRIVDGQATKEDEAAF